MIKIGLCGGIGSGKSYCASIFNSEFNIPIYDSDSRAKALMLEDPIRAELISQFGNSTFLPTGELNRQFLAETVFQNSTQLDILNRIVHPIVRADKNNWMLQQAELREPFSIQEAAILIESGAYLEVDVVVCIYAPFDIRLQRTMQRDSSLEAQVRARMQNQMSDIERFKYSNYVLHNYGEHSIQLQIQHLIQRLQPNSSI